MKKYFPLEVKSKQSEVESEIAKEQYERILGTNSKCNIQ